MQCLAMGQALHAHVLQEALEQRMGRSGASVDLAHAIDVLAALPPSFSAAGPGQLSVRYCAGASSTAVGLCCEGSTSQAVHRTRAAAAWRFVEALPSIAAMLSSLELESAGASENLAVLCSSLRGLATALLEQLPSFASADQLLAWLEAAGAAIRLVQVLAQLRGRLAHSSQPAAADRLSEGLLSGLWGPTATGAMLFAEQHLLSLPRPEL